MKKLMLILPLLLLGCREDYQAQSDSGVRKATVKVKTTPKGLTVEQQNIIDRLQVDNEPGAIKHLYIISPYSGQVIIYSTVRGKVTSGGKRLTPKQVEGFNTNYNTVIVNGQILVTPEVLQDDGTYGDSGDYLFWFDSGGHYHQHYLTGGQIVHVSSDPISVKSVIINMEQ